MSNALGHAYRGYTDVLSPREISGWACDSARPGEPVFVDVVVNNERIAKLRACLFREDLRKLGFGDGRKGFSFDPSRYLQLGENRLRIAFSGTAEILPNGDGPVINLTTRGEEPNRSEAELLHLSQVRWKGDENDVALTWGNRMTGDTFIDVVQKYHRFSGAETILEVGCGYGRLLNTILERQVPFARFVGMELAAARVQKLAAKFNRPNIKFLQADILSDPLEERADIVLCSATFEHLFPSCLKALRNLKNMSNNRARHFIDFLVADDEMNTTSAYFEEQGSAYIRIYSRREMEEAFTSAGYQVLAIEKIVLGKDPTGGDVRRALVVAEPCR